MYQIYTLSSLFKSQSDNKVPSLPKETCQGRFFKGSPGSARHHWCGLGPLAVIRQWNHPWSHELFLQFCPHWFKSLLMLLRCFILSTCSSRDYPGRPHIWRPGLQAAFQNCFVPLSSLSLSGEWLSLFIINRNSLSQSHESPWLCHFIIGCWLFLVWTLQLA